MGPKQRGTGVLRSRPMRGCHCSTLAELRIRTTFTLDPQFHSFLALPGVCVCGPHRLWGSDHSHFGGLLQTWCFWLVVNWGSP